MAKNLRKMAKNQNSLYPPALHRQGCCNAKRAEEAGIAGGAYPELAYIKANPTKDYYFRADRPFVYLIVNEETNTILFMGQYTQGMIKKGNEWKSVNYEGKVKEDISLETTSNSRNPEEGEVLKVTHLAPFAGTKNSERREGI